MFAQPDPDDPNDPNSTRFEPYDIYYLGGLMLIAWALAISIGIALRFS